MSSLKLVVILAQCRYTKTAQRIFKYGDIQYTSLTPDKMLNRLIYRSLFYVNIYESYKLSKNSPFLAQPVYISYLFTHLPLNYDPSVLLEYFVSNISNGRRFTKSASCILLGV